MKRVLWNINLLLLRLEPPFCGDSNLKSDSIIIDVGGEAVALPFPEGVIAQKLYTMIHAGQNLSF